MHHLIPGIVENLNILENIRGSKDSKTKCLDFSQCPQILMRFYQPFTIITIIIIIIIIIIINRHHHYYFASVVTL